MDHGGWALKQFVRGIEWTPAFMQSSLTWIQVSLAVALRADAGVIQPPFAAAVFSSWVNVLNLMLKLALEESGIS